MRYETGDVKSLIRDALSDDDFQNLVQDNYSKIYNGFTTGQGREERTRAIVEHIEKQYEVDVFLLLIKAINPRAFKKFEDQQIQKRLINILNSICLSVIQIAYKLSLPKTSRSRPIPTTVTNLVRIADITGEDGELKPLDRFINFLIYEESVDADCRENLLTWAQDRGIPISVPVPHLPDEPYLTIVVRPSPGYEDRYWIEAHLIKDPEEWNESSSLKIYSSPETQYSQDRLEEIFHKLIEICTEDGTISLKKLTVQWFLPNKLMSLPVEYWQIKPKKNNRLYSGKFCKAVIVGSFDRQSNHRMFSGDWKANWSRISACSELHSAKALDSLDLTIDIDWDLLDLLGCKFIEHEDWQEQEEFWDNLLERGLPIALWCRHSGADLAIMDNVTKCTIVNLPVTLTEHRKQIKVPNDTLPIEPAAHISLLWDNPFRPFPTITYQSS
jgi:vWA-MoxR associated protein C-terminal domain